MADCQPVPLRLVPRRHALLDGRSRSSYLPTHALRFCTACPLAKEERALGVTDRYRHHLPTAEMPAFYHRLDALTGPPYDEEDISLPPLEAMARGVPLAASTIRPLEVLPDEALLRFPPGVPEALVPVVATLADADRRRALAEAGLACVKQFDRERVLDRLEAAFAAEGA